MKIRYHPTLSEHCSLVFEVFRAPARARARAPARINNSQVCRTVAARSQSGSEEGSRLRQ